MKTSLKLRIVLGASCILALSSILIVVFNIGDVKDSKADSSGEYRTVASGEWNDETVWEVFDGTSWNPAEESPKNEVKSITVTEGQNLVLTEEITVNNLVISKGARLDIECNYVKLMKLGNRGGLICHGELSLGDAIIDGDGDFIITQGSVLMIGSDAGIDKKSTSGNIQTKGKKEFHKDATYIFDGTIHQRSGNGLPSVITNLVIDNKSGVELDQHVNITGMLKLKKGILNTSRYQITLGTSQTNTANLYTVEGALCGKIRCWYGPGNIDQLVFHVSDGTSQKVIRLTTDVPAYTKGMAELIYKEGMPDDSKKSPYEARHVVVDVMNKGYYSVSMSNGPDEAWLKFVSSVTDANRDEVISWSISTRSNKNASDNAVTQQGFSNLITGPNPFNDKLIIRFHSESGGVAHLALVNHSGKVIRNEKINIVSGYNQVMLEPGADLSPGDYMVQLSSVSEIQTTRITKSASSLGAS